MNNPFFTIKSDFNEYYDLRINILEIVRYSLDGIYLSTGGIITSIKNKSIQGEDIKKLDKFIGDFYQAER